MIISVLFSKITKKNQNTNACTIPSHLAISTKKACYKSLSGAKVDAAVTKLLISKLLRPPGNTNKADGQLLIKDQY